MNLLKKINVFERKILISVKRIGKTNWENVLRKCIGKTYKKKIKKDGRVKDDRVEKNQHIKKTQRIKKKSFEISRRAFASCDVYR